jgi:hypothetical protein
MTGLEGSGCDISGSGEGSVFAEAVNKKSIGALHDMHG